MKVTDNYRKIVATKEIKSGENIFFVPPGEYISHKEAKKWYDSTGVKYNPGSQQTILGLYMHFLMKPESKYIFYVNLS